METLGVVITGVYFSNTMSVKITPVVETVKLVQAWYRSHPVSQFLYLVAPILLLLLSS